MIINLTANNNETDMLDFLNHHPDPPEQALFVDEKTAVRSMLRYPTAELYACYDHQIFRLKEQAVSEYQEEALRNRQWWIVKEINKIKVKANIFWKETFFDTYPVVLQVESTSFCNARCIMCSHFYKDMHKGKHLAFSQSERLREVLPYVETVMLHGIGEPFMNPDVIKWMQFYKEYGLHLSTFTNMTVLNDELLHAIGASFTALHISCDGCREETYEYIRGNLRFSVFLENVKRLHQTYPELKLHMHTVAMRQNLEEIDEFVQFAHDLGFCSITFSNLSVNPLIRNEGDSLRNFPTMAMRKFRKAEALAAERNIMLHYPREYQHQPDSDECYEAEYRCFHSQPLYPDTSALSERIAQFHQDDLYATEELRLQDITETSYRCEGLCEWLSENAYLDLEGNLAACCSKYYLTMGNLADYSSFSALWNSEQYQKMRKLFYQGKIPRMCQGCRYLVDHVLKNVALLNEDVHFTESCAVGELYERLSG